MKFCMLALLLVCTILLFPHNGQAQLPPTCDPIMYSSERGLSAWTLQPDQCDTGFVFNPNATEPFTLDLQFMYIGELYPPITSVYIGGMVCGIPSKYFELSLEIVSRQGTPPLNGSIIEMTLWNYPACEGDLSLYQVVCTVTDVSELMCPFVCGPYPCNTYDVYCLGPDFTNYDFGYYTAEISVTFLDTPVVPATGSIVSVYVGTTQVPLASVGTDICGFGESEISVYNVFSNCTVINATCGSQYADLVTVSYRDANFSVVQNLTDQCPFAGLVQSGPLEGDSIPPFYGLDINYAALFGDHEGWITNVVYTYAAANDGPDLFPYYFTNCNVLHDVNEEVGFTPRFSQCTLTLNEPFSGSYPGCAGKSFGRNNFDSTSSALQYACNFVVPWRIETPTGIGIYYAYAQPFSGYEFIEFVNYQYAFSDISFVAFDKTANTQTVFSFNFTKCPLGSSINTQQCDCSVGCDTYYASTVVYSILNNDTDVSSKGAVGENSALQDFVVGTQPIQPYQYEVAGYTDYNVGGHLAQEAQCGILIHVTNCTKATQVWLYPSLVETRQVRTSIDIGYTDPWIQCVIRGVQGQWPSSTLWAYPITNNIFNMTTNYHGISFSIGPTVSIEGSTEVTNFTQVYGVEIINVASIPFGGVYISCSTTYQSRTQNIQLFASTPNDPQSNRYFCTSGVDNKTRPVNLNTTTPGVAVARTDIFNITNGTDFGYVQVFVGPSCGNEPLCSDNGWSSGSTFTYTDGINGINLVFPNASANFTGDIGEPILYFDFYEFVALPGFVDTTLSPYQINMLLSVTNVDNIAEIIVSVGNMDNLGGFVDCLVTDPGYYFDYYDNGPIIIGQGIYSIGEIPQTLTSIVDLSSCLQSPMNTTSIAIKLVQFQDDYLLYPPIYYRPMISGVAFLQFIETDSFETIVNAYASFIPDPTCPLNVFKCSDYPLYVYYSMTEATGVNLNTFLDPQCPLNIEINAYVPSYRGPLTPSSFALVTDSNYLGMVYGDTLTTVTFYAHTTNPSGTWNNPNFNFITFDECGQEQVVSAGYYVIDYEFDYIGLCTSYPLLYGYTVFVDTDAVAPYKGYGVSYYGFKVISNGDFVPIVMGALNFEIHNLIDFSTRYVAISGNCIGDFKQAPCECRTCGDQPQPVQVMALIDASNTRSCADKETPLPFFPDVRPYIPEQLINTQPMIQGYLDIFPGFLPLYTILNNSESVYPMPISNDTVESNTKMIAIATELGCGVFIDFNTCSNVAQLWFLPNNNVTVPADAFFTCHVTTRGVPAYGYNSPYPVFVTTLASSGDVTFDYLYDYSDTSVTSFTAYPSRVKPQFDIMGFEVAVADNAPLNGLYISCWLGVPDEIFVNKSYCQARGLQNGSYTVDVTSDVIPFSDAYYNSSAAGCYQRQLVISISTTCDEIPMCGDNGFYFDYSLQKTELSFGVLGYAWTILAPKFGVNQVAQPAFAIGYFVPSAPEFVEFWYNAIDWLSNPDLNFAITLFLQAPFTSFSPSELIVTMESNCFSQHNFSYYPDGTWLDGLFITPTDFIPGFKYNHGHDGPISGVAGVEASFTSSFKTLVSLGVRPEEVVFKFVIANLTKYASIMPNLTTIQTLFMVYGVSLEIVDYRIATPLVSRRVVSTPSPTCRPGDTSDLCTPCDSDDITVSSYYRDTSANYVNLGACPYNIQFQSASPNDTVTSPMIGVGMSTADAGFVYSQTPGTFTLFKGFSVQFATSLPSKYAYLTMGIAFSSVCGSDLYLDQTAFHGFQLNLTVNPSCNTTAATYQYTAQGTYTATSISTAVVNASWISVVFLPENNTAQFFLSTFNLQFADYVGGVFVANRTVTLQSSACSGNYRQETCTCHACGNKDFPDLFGYDVLADVEVTSQLTCNSYLNSNQRRLASPSSSPAALVTELPYTYPITYYLSSSYATDPDNEGLDSGALIVQNNNCGVLLYSPACYRSLQIWLNPLQSLYSSPTSAQCIIQTNSVSNTVPVLIIGGAASGNYTLHYTSFVKQYQINVTFAATSVSGGYMFNQGPYGFELPFFQESPVGGYYISCLLVNNGENLYSGLNFCMANSTYNDTESLAVMRNLSTWYNTTVDQGSACNERVLTIRASPRCEQALLCNQYKASVTTTATNVGYTFDYKGFEYSASPVLNLTHNQQFITTIDLNNSAVINVIDSAFSGSTETMSVLVVLNFKFNTTATSVTGLTAQLISKCGSLLVCNGNTVSALSYYTGVAGSGYVLGYPLDTQLFASTTINMSTCMSFVKTGAFDIRQFYLYINMNFVSLSLEPVTFNLVYLDGITVATLPIGVVLSPQSVVYSNSIVYRPASQSTPQCNSSENLDLTCVNNATVTMSQSQSESPSLTQSQSPLPSPSMSNSESSAPEECIDRSVTGIFTYMFGSLEPSCPYLTAAYNYVDTRAVHLQLKFSDFNVTYPPRFGHNNITNIVFTVTQSTIYANPTIRTLVGITSGFCDDFTEFTTGINISTSNNTLSPGVSCGFGNYSFITKTKIHFNNFANLPVDRHATSVLITTGIWHSASFLYQQLFFFNLTVHTNFRRYSVFNITDLCIGRYQYNGCELSPSESSSFGFSKSKSESQTQIIESESESPSPSDSESESPSASASSSSRSYSTCCVRSQPLSSILANRKTTYCGTGQQVPQYNASKTCPNTDYPILLYPGGTYQLKDYVVENPVYNWYKKNFTQLGLQIGYLNLQFSTIISNVKLYYTPGQGLVRVFGVARMVPSVGSCVLKLPYPLSNEPWIVDITVRTGLNSVPYLSRQPISYGGYPFFVVETDPTANNISIPVYRSKLNRGIIYPDGFPEFNITFGLQTLSPIVLDISVKPAIAGSIANAEMIITSSLELAQQEAGSSWTGIAAFQTDANCSNITAQQAPLTSDTYAYLQWLGCQNYENTQPQTTPWPASNGTGWMLFGVESLCNEDQPLTPGIPGASGSKSGTQSKSQSMSRQITQSFSAQLSPLPPPNITNYNITRQPRVCYPFNSTGGEVPAFMVQFGSSGTVCGIINDATTIPVAVESPGIYYGSSNLTLNPWDLGLFLDYYAVFNTSVVEGGDIFVKFNLFTVVARVAIYIKIQWYTGSSTVPLPGNFQTLVGVDPASASICGMAGSSVASCIIPFPAYNHPLYIGYRTTPRFVLPFNVQLRGVVITPLTWSPVTATSYCAIAPNITLGTYADGACRSGGGGSNPSDGTYSFNERVLVDGLDIILTSGSG